MAIEYASFEKHNKHKGKGDGVGQDALDRPYSYINYIFQSGIIISRA